MSGRNLLPTTVIFMLLIALAVVGVGYALWSDELVVYERVSTGDVLVGIRDVGTNDDPDDLDGVPNFEPGTGLDPWVYLPGPTELKDVASTVSENLGEVKCSNGEVDYYDEIRETLSMVYPSYGPTMVMEIYNCGSIPVKIQSFNMTDDNPALAGFVDLAGYVITLDGVLVNQFMTQACVPGLWNRFSAALFGIQIEPEQVLEIRLTKHIAQHPDCAVDGPVLPMGETVEFTETFTFVQWNEFDPEPVIGPAE